jgi:hypothetical protein
MLNTVLRKNKFTHCSNKIQYHKPVVICTFCEELFHVKCAKLQPDDLNTLNKLNLLNSWSCYSCILTIFPVFLLELDNNTIIPNAITPPRRNSIQDALATHVLNLEIFLMSVICVATSPIPAVLLAY